MKPDAIRELAQQADELAEAISGAHAAFRDLDGDDPLRRVGYRLPDAGGCARAIARDLRATADDIARIIDRPPGSCQVPWGVCPQHGNTLTSSGGTTWCRADICGRQWTYDRLGLPCAVPATHRVADQAGAELLMCDGHARDAAKRLDGAVITRLDAPPAHAPDRRIP